MAAFSSVADSAPADATALVEIAEAVLRWADAKAPSLRVLGGRGHTDRSQASDLPTMVRPNVPLSQLAGGNLRALLSVLDDWLAGLC